jgi:hypothetical protein
VNILKKTGPWIISAVLCLLTVEILGVALFYRNTQSLIYFNHAQGASTPATAEPAAATGYKQHLHPYFGYTGPYSLHGISHTNNLGFPQLQTHEVPFKPEPNDFVIFVFGGSVASNLVSPPKRGTSLQHALEKLPQLAGKNIVIYSMAQGPQKQPQHLMELAFLIAAGQHFDFVVNVDGTLEFVSAMTNFLFGVDPIFPPVDVMGAIGNELAPINSSSEEYYELAYSVTHARAESQRYALLIRDSTNGFAYVKNTVFKAIHDRRLAEKLKTYTETIGKAAGWEGTRKRMGLDMSIKTSKERLVEDAFNMWIRCSDLMKTMTNSTGARYLNIVHPNPYHSKKVFTEEEKTILNLPETNFVRQGSSVGHAFIESHAEILKSRGIVSGISLFDDVPDTIYADSTGHFGKLGESMLADYVATQVGLKLASPQSN